ncbi:MAG: NADH-quinone oxidoreductase subunit L [Sulfuricella sp.]
MAGFLLLALSGGSLPRRIIALVGVGSVAFSALAALLAGYELVTLAPPGHAFVQTLWHWIDVAGFTPTMGLRLDALSLVMVLVVTLVGFFILLYAAESMAEEEGYNRFFAGINLFVAAMCALLLADNLLFLFLGWEGVTLCSYLLIGFWYRDAANGRAARKAFVVSRCGDVAFTLGLLLLFTQLGTLDIQEAMRRATQQWPAGSGLASAAALLLLGGAVGKSAQMPLQTWLPDAMAGPTPVSALIHAATMVTAGVYLIARTHALYLLAPAVQGTVAAIGALTLLLAGCSALVQHDLKRVLAYSTISQIGYMFLALGVGAWSAAIFHFVTHAFFKALLFLSAGVVITSLHDEHDIFRMGGLRTRLPLAFWSFLIGASSLAALPLVTAGFYSKELILRQAWASPEGGVWMWSAGWVGALLTAAYIFRAVFVVFFGTEKTQPAARPGWRIKLPLIVLAGLSLVGGLIGPVLSDYLPTALPPQQVYPVAPIETVLGLLGVAASVAGVSAAYLLYLRRPRWFARLAQTGPAAVLGAFWQGGWGFDTFYDRVLVRPYLAAARASRTDFFDLPYTALAGLCRWLHSALSASQDGRVRRYAGSIALGAVIVAALALLPW